MSQALYFVVYVYVVNLPKLVLSFVVFIVSYRWAQIVKGGRKLLISSLSVANYLTFCKLRITGFFIRFCED